MVLPGTGDGKIERDEARKQASVRKLCIQRAVRSTSTGKLDKNSPVARIWALAGPNGYNIGKLVE